MNIKTCDPDTTEAPSISRAGFPGLRLVVGGVGEIRGQEELVDDRALPCAVLKSAIADPLTQLILDHDLGQGSVVTVRVRQGAYSFACSELGAATQST